MAGDTLTMVWRGCLQNPVATMVLDLFATDGAGQDEAVFKLASDIQVDQITEIERMKLMLQSRNLP